LCFSEFRGPPPYRIVEVIEEIKPEGKQVTAPSNRARSFLWSTAGLVHSGRIADGY